MASKIFATLHLEMIYHYLEIVYLNFTKKGQSVCDPNETRILERETLLLYKCSQRRVWVRKHLARTWIGSTNHGHLFLDFSTLNMTQIFYSVCLLQMGGEKLLTGKSISNSEIF